MTNRIYRKVEEMEKSNGKYLLLVVALLGLISTISSCGENLESGAKTSTPVEVIVLTQTHDPTNTLAPAFTIVSSPTPTHTLIPPPTWTPAPTLQPDEAHDLVLELLELNSGCELPCWWGIDPRSSRWPEVASFFDRFGSVTKIRFLNFSEGNDYIGMYVYPPGIIIDIDIQYFLSDYQIKKIFIHTEKRKNSDGYGDDYNNPAYFQVMHNYTLENILAKYGQPSQVLLRSFSPSPSWFETQTLIYYPDFGISVEFFSDNNLAIIEGTQFVETCPAEGFIALRLFDPNQAISLQELLEPYGNFSRYLELEDATEMTIEEFYEAFQTSGCKTKILTPMDLWPSEYDN